MEYIKESIKTIQKQDNFNNKSHERLSDKLNIIQIVFNEKHFESDSTTNLSSINQISDSTPNINDNNKKIDIMQNFFDLLDDDNSNSIKGNKNPPKKQRLVS